MADIDKTEPVTFVGHHGITLVGDRRGDLDAPTVLLLHGGGQTRHSWGGTAAALAKRGWCAITLDARGHGDSDWHDAGDYSLTAFALDVRDVARVLPVAPLVVGASLGGCTAMLLEGEVAPGSTRAIVLVDVVPLMNEEGTDRIQRFMHERLHDGFATLEEARDAIAAYNTFRPPPSDLEGLKKNLRLGEDGRWRWHWDPRFTSGGPAGSGPSEITDQQRMRRACRQLRVPVMLVRGRMSDVVTVVGVESFRSDVPTAEFVDVSGAGHMVAGDRNDAFTDAVVDFLQRHR
ncbi:MAG TPA: alpha/beta hydrolase [Acidimicrobiales bacterium]|nr:alpha/beta hydrolase [Acidimicrobiales bacterium]